MAKVQVTMEFDWPWADEPKGAIVENTYDSLRRMETSLYEKLIDITSKINTVYGDNKPDPLRLTKHRVYRQELDVVQKAINNASVKVVED